MAYDPATETVVLFGGYLGSTNSSETRTRDGVTWTQQFPPVSPSARQWNANGMVFDSLAGKVVLFGELADSSFMNDTWEWDGASKTWTETFPAHSTSPRAATLAYDETADLYSQILGIREPWRVDRVDLDLKQRELNVHLTHDVRAEWPCPECGTVCPLYDHQASRRRRPLDTCQLRTIINADPPRSNCPEHGARTVRLPGAEPGRFTALVEALAIDWLHAASQQAVADRLNLSWDEVHAIQVRAVKRGPSIEQLKVSTSSGLR